MRLFLPNQRARIALITVIALTAGTAGIAGAEPPRRSPPTPDPEPPVVCCDSGLPPAGAFFDTDLTVAVAGPGTVRRAAESWHTVTVTNAGTLDVSRVHLNVDLGGDGTLRTWSVVSNGTADWECMQKGDSLACAGGLGAGERATVSLLVAASPAYPNGPAHTRRYEIRAVVDPDDVVRETNEANNEASLVANVLSP